MHVTSCTDMLAVVEGTLAEYSGGARFYERSIGQPVAGAVVVAGAVLRLMTDTFWDALPWWG